MRRSYLHVKSLCMLLIISFSFSMFMTNVGDTSSSTQLYVNPPKIEYWIPACGETFKVNVSIADVSNLQSFEFKLYWNTSQLDLVEIELQQFLSPTLWLFRNEINETLGRYWLNVTTISGPPTDGSGTLVTLSFQITYEPVWPQNVTSALNLVDTKLADSSGGSIPHDVYNGEYWCYCTSFLSLTTTTDKPFYDINETIHVYGNLSLGFSPVQDGLVALEVADPLNSVIVIRTLDTGTPPASQIIEIVDVIPCGGEPDYNPRSWFYRGATAYFNVSIKNNYYKPLRVQGTINLHDANLTPLGYFAFEGTINDGETTWFIPEIKIPSTASLGNATVYASALKGALPRDGGAPYCPEESAIFEIREIGGGETTPQQNLGDSPEGTYNLTFRLPPDATSGIYRVYAAASYQEYSATCGTAFGVDAISVPDHYPTIQQAVNAASPTNNSILVMPGTYEEQVTINKRLTLVGRDQKRTIIEGSGAGTVVTVTANNVTISLFTIQNSGSSFPDSGITLEDSSDSTIRDNTILKNYYGIRIHSSDSSFIRNNKLSGNNYGIYLNHSANIVFRNNIMGCNKYSFGVFGDSASDFTHAVDTSNMVNGKPVIYWINQHNREVPSNAGFVAIVNSTNISLRELDLKKNAQGVLFAFTNDSVIERVEALSNEYGIYFAHSYNNLIIGSAVSSNFVGIYQRNSNGNTIFHNNFVDNVNQVELYQSSNTWDDGMDKGNYWSDYTGADDGSGGRIAGDGVGDTLLPHQDVDWYPLMNPWILVHDVAATSVTYSVTPYNGSLVYPITGWKVMVTVTVKNEGDFIETFDVTAYANTTIIQTQVVTLPVRSSTSITLTWNMHEYVPIGNYTISGYAKPVTDEKDKGDNTYIDGIITVTEPGSPDINGDGLVDIVDIVIVAIAFGSFPGHPDWNRAADLNGDGIIDIVDIVLVAIHFGETYP